MKNTYNFNIAVEVPEKSIQEQILFLKWKPVLRREQVTDEVIEEYKNDLLSLKLNNKINELHKRNPLPHHSPCR